MSADMRLKARADRGGIYYVFFTRTKAVSLKTKDRALALELYRELKRDYLANNLAVLAGRPRPRPLGEFVAEYLVHRETAIPSPLMSSCGVGTWPRSRPFWAMKISRRLSFMPTWTGATWTGCWTS